jgi:hypothetical protein
MAGLADWFKASATLWLLDLRAAVQVAHSGDASCEGQIRRKAETQSHRSKGCSPLKLKWEVVTIAGLPESAIRADAVNLPIRPISVCDAIAPVEGVA